MKLLATADIHLGLQPSRVKEAEARRYASRSMWLRIVEHAIDTGVDAVLLAGDVVDEANRFFEAVGPLEAGLRQLGDAGIQVVAVSGNHDWDVLPRLADREDLRNLILLGRDGQWEPRVLSFDGEPRLQVVGWSFPRRDVPTHPLDDFPREELDGDLPVLGLLHADLNEAKSPYCPVPAAALVGTGVPLWVLGHIHKPQPPSEAGTQILYPGSPQGMDPGEPGLHGPWLISWEGGWQVAQVPLAPLIYDELTIDISGVEDEAALQSRLTDVLFEATRTRLDEHPDLEAIVWRLTVTGRTRLRAPAVQRQVELLREDGLEYREVRLAIDRATVATRPEVEVAALADESSLRGELAELLLSAMEGEAADEDLMKDVGQQLQEIQRARAYSDLREEAIAEPRELVAGLAWELLDALQAPEEAEDG